MNKLRSDSAFCQLTPEQTDMLEGWLFEERLGYPKVVEKLKAEFGLETSLTGVRRFYKRLDVERSAQSLMDAAEMSGLTVEALKSGELKPAMLLFANTCLFELLRQSPVPIKEVTTLLRAITSAEAHTMRQTIYEREQAELREAKRIREARESWRITPQDLEEEKEELRQQRAARKRAKQEAAEKAAKESENSGVAELKADGDGRVSPLPPGESTKLNEPEHPLTPAQWLPKPAPSQFPEEERALRATGSPNGGEGEGFKRRIVQGFRAGGSASGNFVSNDGKQDEGAVNQADKAAAKEGCEAWQPSVVEGREHEESYEADEAESRLTPLNAA